MLSQVARATPEVAAGKRLGAHLFIHVSHERSRLKGNTTQFENLTIKPAAWVSILFFPHYICILVTVDTAVQVAKYFS